MDFASEAAEICRERIEYSLVLMNSKPPQVKLCFADSNLFLMLLWNSAKELAGKKLTQSPTLKGRRGSKRNCWEIRKLKRNISGTFFHLLTNSIVNVALTDLDSASPHLHAFIFILSLLIFVKKCCWIINGRCSFFEKQLLNNICLIGKNYERFFSFSPYLVWGFMELL